jgi:hypothetical protein
MGNEIISACAQYQPSDNLMTWVNGPLIVHHGTTGRFADSIVASGIDLMRCRPLSDFGRGFYTTPNFDQAKEHANTLYRKLAALSLSSAGLRPAPICAAVITYRVDRGDLSQLEHLTFVNPTADWSAFVAHCRSAGGPHVPSTGGFYEVVYGPLQGPKGTAYPRNYEQVSFHSQMGIIVLQAPAVARGSPLL